MQTISSYNQLTRIVNISYNLFIPFIRGYADCKRESAGSEIFCAFFST